MTDANEDILIEKPAAPAAPIQPAAPAGALAELVGEGKKYKTEADLVRAIYEKDNFIERLQNENRGIREDLSKATETKDALEELKASLRKDKGGSEVPTAPALDPVKVEQMLDEALHKRETERVRQANIKEANAMLLKQFGDKTKAAEAVEKRAAELGLSRDDIVAMAAKSPKAITTLFGGVAAPKEPEPIGRKPGGVPLNVAAPADEGVKASFDRMRREDAKRYWSPAVQNEIMRLVREGKYV